VKICSDTSKGAYNEAYYQSGFHCEIFKWHFVRTLCYFDNLYLDIDGALAPWYE